MENQPVVGAGGASCSVPFGESGVLLGLRAFLHLPACLLCAPLTCATALPLPFPSTVSLSSTLIPRTRGLVVLHFSPRCDIFPYITGPWLCALRQCPHPHPHAAPHQAQDPGTAVPAWARGFRALLIGREEPWDCQPTTRRCLLGIAHMLAPGSKLANTKRKGGGMRAVGVCPSAGL